MISGKMPFMKCETLASPRNDTLSVGTERIGTLRSLLRSRCDKVSVLCTKGGDTCTGLFLGAPLFRIRLCYGCNFYRRIGRKPKPTELSELCLEVSVDFQLQRVVTSIFPPHYHLSHTDLGSLECSDD